jgi:amylosucrase
MALLGEAIVAPKEIIKYFGTDNYTANECDVAYNATQMALQWDALATGDTRIMLTAQHDILQKHSECAIESEKARPQRETCKPLCQRS